MTARAPIRIAVLLALLAAATAHAADVDEPVAAAPVRVVPAVLDFGEWPAGGATRGRAWLVNTSARTLRIRHVGADGDGIGLPGFRSRPMPPGGALPVDVELTAAPDEGVRRQREIEFRFDDGSTVRLVAAMTSVHPDLHLPEPLADEPAGTTLRIAPRRVHLGDASPGETATGSLWLINAGDAPVRLAAAKASCACLELDVEPMDLAPGRAREVPLRMVSEGVIGQQRVKYATFIVDGQPPLSTTVSLTVVDPIVSVARRWIAARDGDQAGLARAFLAPDFDAAQSAAPRPGLGRLLDPDGTGPWAQWDEANGARTVYVRVTLVDPTTVEVVARHENDLDPLLGRSGRDATIRLSFNNDREITRIDLVDFDCETGGDAWPAFMDWLERTQPATLAHLLPQAGADPRAADADRWRVLAQHWQRAGRPRE